MFAPEHSPWSAALQPVTLYTKPFCPYCARAMSLLKNKGVAFTEIEAAYDPAKKAEMVQRAGGVRPFPRSSSGTPMSAAATTWWR
jgi:hypothetical protein